MSFGGQKGFLIENLLNKRTFFEHDQYHQYIFQKTQNYWDVFKKNGI